MPFWGWWATDFDSIPITVVGISNIVRRILKENPDHIDVNGENISYDACDGSYTFAVFTGGIGFIVEDSGDFYGHGTCIQAFRRYLRDQVTDHHELENCKRFKTNIPLDQFPSMLDTERKGRVWPKYKVLAIWGEPEPHVTKTCLELVELVCDPKDFRFEVRGGTFGGDAETDYDTGASNILTYDEFVMGRALSREEKEKQAADKELYNDIMTGKSKAIPQQGHDENRFAKRQKGKSRQFVNVPPATVPKDQRPFSSTHKRTQADFMHRLKEPQPRHEPKGHGTEYEEFWLHPDDRH